MENLRLATRAAPGRGEPLGHVLPSAPAGLGKTTLARLLARECGAGFQEVVAANIRDPHQLVALLVRPAGAAARAGEDGCRAAAYRPPLLRVAVVS